MQVQEIDHLQRSEISCYFRVHGGDIRIPKSRMMFAMEAISSYLYAKDGDQAHGKQEKNETPSSILGFLLVSLLRIPIPPLD